MKFLYNNLVLKHNPGSDEEGSYRFDGINKNVESELIRFNGEDFLHLIHSEKYIQSVKEASEKELFFEYIQNNKESYSIACLAVGMAIQASEEGLFALCRPPGHHAHEENGDGYCLFNNIAIATNKLIEEGKKIAIIDFDAHFGDGTAAIFFGNPAVKYFSIHEEKQWPISKKLGWHKNCYYCPIKEHSKDDILLKWGEKVKDEINKFKPNIIGISAGFDGLEGNSISNLDFSIDGFKKLGEIIGGLKIKSFAVLEGGYHNKIYECASGFLEGFNSTYNLYTSNKN